MQITEDQKATVKKLIEEGCGLQDIQNRLNTEHKLSLTYMDVRFLLLDLGLSVKEKATPKAAELDITKAKAAKAVPPPADGVAEEVFEDEDAPVGPGGVSIEIDRIKRPGALVSGSVTFSDGVKSNWSLDQFGRLALEGGKEGYRPSKSDIQAFQQELTRLLQSRGGM